MTYLNGRTALITGGLTGQGLAIGQALAAAGANVAAGSFIGQQHGRRDDAAAYPESDEITRVAAGLSVHGTRVHAGHLDVRDTAG